MTTEVIMYQDKEGKVFKTLSDAEFSNLNIEIAEKLAAVVGYDCTPNEVIDVMETNRELIMEYLRVLDARLKP